MNIDNEAANALLSALKAALADLEGCWKYGVQLGYQHHQIRSLPAIRAAIKKAEAPRSADDLAVVKAAQDEWNRDGEIELDDDAIVSWGADDGAYVQAWVWVNFEAAGLPQLAKQDGEDD